MATEWGGEGREGGQTKIWFLNFFMKNNVKLIKASYTGYDLRKLKKLDDMVFFNVSGV